MPQSGVGSMQGKDTGNMPSAVCASSLNKSLTPLQYKCKVLHKSSLHENVVFSVCSRMGNAAYIIFIMWSSISGLNT